MSQICHGARPVWVGGSAAKIAQRPRAGIDCARTQIRKPQSHREQEQGAHLAWATRVPDSKHTTYRLRGCFCTALVAIAHQLHII